MKIGVQTMKKGICLGCVIGADVAEKYANAARFGFQTVEPGTLGNAADRAMHAELAEANGIKVSSVMNQAHWGKPLSDPDADVRKASVDGIVQSIDTAVVLGADTVLVVPAVVNDTVCYEDAWERSIESIKTVLPYAREQGVVLAVENVWNKFLLSPIEFAAYVDAFDDEYMKAYFDVGNIVLFGIPQQWIRTLGKRICKIHVKGFDAASKAFVQLRAGSIDWAAVMAALRDTGYDDSITAELNAAGDDKVAGFQVISDDMDAILAS
jgi:L-ribulose-5-phosphate 3-epimerase